MPNTGRCREGHNLAITGVTRNSRVLGPRRVCGVCERAARRRRYERLARSKGLPYNPRPDIRGPRTPCPATRRPILTETTSPTPATVTLPQAPEIA